MINMFLIKMYLLPIRDGHKYIKKDLVTNDKYLLIKYNNIKMK